MRRPAATCGWRRGTADSARQRTLRGRSARPFGWRHEFASTDLACWPDLRGLGREDGVFVVEEAHADGQLHVVRVVDAVAHPPGDPLAREDLVVGGVEAVLVYGVAF